MGNTDSLFIFLGRRAISAQQDENEKRQREQAGEIRGKRRGWMRGWRRDKLIDGSMERKRSGIDDRQK